MIWGVAVSDRVEKCRHLGTTSGGKTGHYETDLVFLEDGPYLVFEWADLPSGESVPSVSVPVDSERLAEINWTNCRYMLEGGAVAIPDGIARFN